MVGLCLRPGQDLVALVLAGWQAGAAYLPLDPGYPADRLAFMLRDSQVTVVAGTADALDQLPAGRIRTIAVDDPQTTAALAVLPPSGPDLTVLPGQLAQVIYTSGSTGVPKGVQVTHRGLLSYLAGVPGRAGLGEPGGRYALLQSAVTDFGNTMIFTSLVTGGVLHILDPAAAISPAAVAGYLARHRIDYLKLVPSHLAALAQHEPARARRLATGWPGCCPAGRWCWAGRRSRPHWPASWPRWRTGGRW